MRLGAQAVELREGTQHARGLRRRARDLRAPPPPLRGEQRVPPAARRRGPRRQRDVPGGAPRRDRRAARPSVVRRLAVPSGVQVAADAARAALPRVRRRRARPRPVGRERTSKSHRIRWRRRSSISSSSSPRCRALRARSARSRTSCIRYLARLRPRRRRGRRGPAIGSTMGNLYARIEPTADGEPLLPLRAPRHRAADRGDRAGGRGRGRAERRRDDPRRRQQGGGRGDARGDAARARREAAARRDRAALHPEGGGRARRRLRLRPHAGSGRGLGYVYDQAAPIGDGHPRRAVLAVARGDVPRPRGALGHAPGGRALGDRRGGARDLGDPARADRRGVDGERRDDHRRHGREHRPRVVHVRRGGALARRAEARRPRPGDAGRDHVRGRRRRVRRRDDGAQELPRLPLRAATTGRSRSPPSALARCGYERRLRAAREAPPTRTSSTSAGCSA